MTTNPRTRLCTQETVKSEGLNIWFDSTLDGTEPKVDIILVQGLGAHPYYTWVGRHHTTTAIAKNQSRSKLRRFLARGKAQEGEGTAPTIDEGIFWPRDLLPKHVGPARIATYSYLSAWEKKGFRTSLRECGQQFLNILHQFRSDDSTRERPIVFVGHSLGGLVIQQALVLADHSKVFANVRTSTSGIIFLGVPMQGSESADILAFITDALGNEQPILRTLKAHSPELNALSDDFWSSHGALPAMFFCETNDSRYVPLLRTTTVNVRSSSVIGRRTMFLHTDHSGLNKFREDDEKFHLFIPSLKEMITTAQMHSYTKAEREGLDPVERISEDLYSGTGRVILPFPKDDDFVGRKGVLKKIEKISHSTQQDSRVALVGLGGIGKSQIAIEYAHQFRAKYPERSVFWVYGTNPARFRTSYAEIAKELCLPGCDDPKRDQLDPVRRWLQSEASGSWLMILDNVDDRSFVADYHNKAAMLHDFTLLAHLPRKPGTMVLITSRDRDAAYDLVHQKQNSIVEIECMNDVDTKALLNAKLDDTEALETEKEQLIQKLDSIPLAITQAAAYMKRRQMVTISKYLELLDVCERDPKSVLNVDGGDSRRDPGVPNAVFRTWQITLDLIQAQHPESASLLSIMAMFDRQGIPGFLFKSEPDSSVVRADESGDGDRAFSYDHHEALAGHYNSSSSSEKQPSSNRDRDTETGCQARSAANSVSNPEQERLDHEDGILPDNNDKHLGLFDDEVEVLLGFSLVSKQESGETFQMHRLIQLATTRWLKDRGVLQYFSEKALNVLTQAYPTDVIKGWEVTQVLEPHADLVHGRTYHSKESTLCHARLSCLRAGFFSFKGSYHRAEAIAKIAVQGYENTDERDTEGYFQAMLELSDAHQEQWEYKEAASVISSAIDQARVVLGEGSPTYIKMLDALGVIASEQGHESKAIGFMEIAVDLARKFLGNQDPIALQCALDLAWNLLRTGRLDEAEKLCLSTLKIMKRVLDESDALLLGELQILAKIYFTRGRTMEAENVQRDVLHRVSKRFGEEHQGTLVSMYNLAHYLDKQGLLEEAEMLKTKILDGQKRVLGLKHPSTIETMISLAYTCKRRDKHAEALSLMTAAVHLSDDILGYNHLLTEEGRNTLKMWYSQLQQDDATQHHILEAEEEARALLRERYSYSLSECLFELYSQRSCQTRAAADESGENELTKLSFLSRELVAALRLWLEKNCSYGIHTIGKILGLMRRDTDAQIMFEGLLRSDPTVPSASETSRKISLVHDLAGSTDGDAGAKTRQDLRKEKLEQGIELETQSVKSTEGESVTESCVAKSSEDDSDWSIRGHAGKKNEEHVFKGASVENSSSAGGCHEMGIWTDNSWCDDCDRLHRLPSLRYICIECRYIELCETCYDKLQVGGTLASDKLKDCKRHRFISVPRPEWYGLPWGVVSEDGTTLMQWAEKLLAEFSE